MYAITEADRSNILALNIEGYPEGKLTDEIERKVALTLPLIEGLHPDMSNDERATILMAATANSLKEFVAMHGNAFGCVIQVHEKKDASTHQSKSTLCAIGT